VLVGFDLAWEYGDITREHHLSAFNRFPLVSNTGNEMTDTTSSTRYR